MKQITPRLILTMLLTAIGLVATAQDAIMLTLQQMMKKYPSADCRMEYRYIPSDEKPPMFELRYEFGIGRQDIDPTDLKTIIGLYEKAWQSSDPKKDQMQRYAHKDSICSTIIYRSKQNNYGNLLNHRRMVFWGNPGFLLFDLGKYVTMTADKIEPTKHTPQKFDPANILNLVDKLSKNHTTKKTAVRFTGQYGYFLMQRGSGRGWTHGHRYTIEDCTRQDFERLRQAFHTHFDNKEAVNLIDYNHLVQLKHEQGPEIFVVTMRHNTIYFLSATVENEVCIPMDWETVNCYNNGEVNMVDVSRLDSLFNHWKERAVAPPTEVSYTGAFIDGMRGFAMQRGWGKGWTHGQRLQLPTLDEKEKESIFDVFRSYNKILKWMRLESNRANTYEEGTRTFYGFQQADDGRAFLLRATAENEICIPLEWIKMDYYKGAEQPSNQRTDYIAEAPKQTRYLYGLGKLWSGVRQNFVFMDKVKINWDSLYVSLMPRIAAAKDNREAVKILQEMAAQLHDGHTFIYSSGIATNTAPLQTKRIGDRVYVSKVLSSKLQERGARRGLELTAINGMPVDEYVKKFKRPYVSSSTPQWTDHACYDGFALAQFESGNQISFTLKDGDRSFDVSYTANEAPWDLKTDNSSPLSFSVQDDNIGYLRISSFESSEVTARFDSIYPALLDTRGLIIDIRGNGGGNSGFSDHIVRHFATDTLISSSWQSPMYVPALVSWGYPAQWYRVASRKMAPLTGKQVYSNPVVLLVDNGTFSSAEDFCSLFRSINRGKLIGTPTGGSTGNGVRIELIPDVAFANICSKHDTPANGIEFVGHGFTPDILIEETYQSFFVDKHDAATTAALRTLKEELEKR